MVYRAFEGDYYAFRVLSMSRQILGHRHQVDGSIEVWQMPGDVVALLCRWPLDLDTGEWFNLNEAF